MLFRKRNQVIARLNHLHGDLMAYTENNPDAHAFVCQQVPIEIFEIDEILTPWWVKKLNLLWWRFREKIGLVDEIPF